MAKILVVDDSVSMRQMLCFTLKDAGYDVIESSSSEEALEQIDGIEVQLVLSDLNMPGMDGIELAKVLRSTPLYQSTPILILSTESSQEVKQRGRDAGITGWITKPFNPDQLLQISEQVIK
ncbi:MAG: response regulator [Porticoccus sp.]|nr:response regulator [Porticoccus sp.]